MADEHDKDDEHYAPESGEPDSDAVREEPVESEHDKDDEHYAPES